MRVPAGPPHLGADTRCVVDRPKGLVYCTKDIRYSIPIAKEMYIKEMEHFLKVIRGEEKYMVDLSMAKRLFKLSKPPKKALIEGFVSNFGKVIILNWSLLQLG